MRSYRRCSVAEQEKVRAANAVVAAQMQSFFTIIPLEVMPQSQAEIGIKVKEFRDKFKITTPFDKK